MLTVTIYFRIKNQELFDGKVGYQAVSLDFDEKSEAKGLDKIRKIPEIVRKSQVKIFECNDSDIEIISRDEYVDSTEDK